MSATLPNLLALGVHGVLVVGLAPMAVGLARWAGARLQGRRGASPLQPWRDILKLLRRPPVVAAHASPLVRLAPYGALTATGLAALLVPGFAGGMALAGMSDLLLILGLLALARVLQALAGFDAGNGFGGLGAGREMAFGTLAAPALLLCVLSLAALANTTNLDGIAALFREGWAGVRVSLLLVLVAMLAVALAENARVPLHNPVAHPELTTVHEAMILEASGRHLALWEMQAAVKLLLWMSLLAALFLPFGMALSGPGAGVLPWLWGLGAWLGKLAVLCLALAVAESVAAKLRVLRVPGFLGAATLLAALAAALLLVSAGAA